MRTCLIDIPGLSSRLLEALAGESAPPWFDAVVDRGQSVIRPVLPALTMTVQATYGTGVSPADHGMIANGLPAYRLPDITPHLDLSNFSDYRCNVSFWEQSTKLLTAPRIWEESGRRVAMLFVQSSMGGAAEVVVTPKPQHTPDGKTISMCWSDPAQLYPKLREQLGEFPLHHYWGPMAGMKSSEWIAAAARLVWEWEPTDLQWVYIPQMDYDLQRLGPDDPRCAKSLAALLGVLTPLVEKVHADGGQVLIVSEYGMTKVSRFTAPNVALAHADLLKTTAAGEVDYAASEAFAMVDHQVAHVYCKSAAAIDAAAKTLGGLPEVAHIYRGDQRGDVGLDCERAGDLVVFAHGDAWFEYRWWSDWAKAPAYAWMVDIHRKPGYDPCEMFADPATRKIEADQPQLIKGSHGALPADEIDWPVLLGHPTARAKIDATDVAELI
ncbi:MAG: alkaline phosphatase family protein [Planctomycetes bacterium]|nr:alkaline phosphatase family protein [Planctomycetota bacterium]